MYFIEFSKKSRNFFNKLEDIDKKIIANKLNSIRENPFRFLKKLKGSKLWRLRILKYRLIVDVIVSKNKIIVLRIGHRRNVY